MWNLASKQQNQKQLGVMAPHAFDPYAWEARQADLSEFQFSQGYILRPHLKNNNNKKQTKKKWFLFSL